MNRAADDARERGAHPSGEVTFLFTDLENSTQLWEAHPAAMEGALEVHDERLRAAVEARGGYVFTTAGDSFAVAFSSVDDALAATVDAQLRLLEPCGQLVLKIRTGLHRGVASLRDGDYFGSVVNRSARLMSAGHGGQILVSGAVRALVAGALPEGIDLLDLGEHRLKDLREPEHIYQVVHPDLAAEFAPLRTLRDQAAELPQQLTDFVGREEDLAEVHRLLDERRMVTLTGSGGSGKTRLALQVAADSVERYPGGVRLVELAPLTDPDIIADEVAGRVGAQPSPDTGTIRAITERIGDQQMLLLLDNCEHVIEPAATLCADLLRSCPRLRILATSQEALGISGEVRYRVPSLSVPDDADGAAAAESGAVRLFVDRAVAVRPDFQLDDDNVAAVVSICRHLDGIPLALELAAARVRVLSPEQIEVRLGERFELLGGGGRDRHPRQQTLRATMDWSHDLLSDEERAVFRRLGVFAADFTLEAAEAVCAGDPVDPFMVLDLVTSLVDKSLVSPEHSKDETRFRLTESVRAYASAKLAESGEEHAVRTRHSAHYRDVAEGLYVRRRGGDLPGAIDGLGRDEDNFRAALRCSLDDEDPETTARIIGAIGYLWYVEGLFREGIDWCAEFFATDPELDDELLARPLHLYGTLLGSWEQPRAGAEMLQREADLLRGLDEPARLGGALNNLGNLLNDMGRTEEAEVALREAIEQLRAGGESPALSYVSLGYGYLHGGRYDDAIAANRAVIEGPDSTSEEYAVALATLYLGQCAVLDGDVAGGRSLVTEARESFLTLHVPPGIGYGDMVLGSVQRQLGDEAAAATHFLDALEEPDAHWYQATKYWILQLAAGLPIDRHVAAALVSTAESYYSRVEEPQPSWVLEDLELARDRLADAEPGAALGPEAAVEAARAALRVVAGAA